MDHVTSDPNFKMLHLTKLTSKALQLDAMRLVQLYASSSFKLLNKQKNALKALLHYMKPSRNHGMSLGIQESDTNPTENPPSQNVSFQHGPSQNCAYNHGPSVVERTLQRYSLGYFSPKPQCSPIKINTPPHPESGLPHPYNKSKNLLS